MGYYEDHLNSVADRWKVKYKESGLTLDQFFESMERVLTVYGWSKEEVERMKERIKRDTVL